ncbi:MAG: efflux RND transporter periplasmic adaptor subunit [Acidobacteriota bacterium]|nr:efflux RND transporter periplasmic adaptor subunit [Acidobacteriota bacterium]
MKRVLSLVIIAAIGAAGWFALTSRTSAPVEASFETVRVSRQTLDRTVTATGVIRPVVGAEIEVGSRVSGMVRELPVRVGDQVEAGDLLAVLDPIGFEALVAQSEADLALARAQWELSQSSERRIAALAGKGLATPQELDSARGDLKVARARVELAEARLRSARIDLGYTRITAPIRGVIADISTREGETVAAAFAAPKFVTIVDLSRLEVRAYVDETDIGRIFIGQEATFSVDTYPDKAFSAKVTAIQPKAEIQGSVVNYVVVLRFKTPPETTPRPEMTAHVRLVMDRREGALTVPREVLRRRDGRQYVMVKRGDSWQEQIVRIGWRTNRSAEVLDGLAEGEVVQVN